MLHQSDRAPSRAHGSGDADLGWRKPALGPTLCAACIIWVNRVVYPTSADRLLHSSCGHQISRTDLLNNNRHSIPATRRGVGKRTAARKRPCLCRCIVLWRRVACHDRRRWAILVRRGAMTNDPNLRGVTRFQPWRLGNATSKALYSCCGSLGRTRA